LIQTYAADSNVKLEPNLQNDQISSIGEKPGAEKLLPKGEYRHVFQNLRILQSNKNTVQIDIFIPKLKQGSCGPHHVFNKNCHGLITTLILKNRDGRPAVLVSDPQHVFYGLYNSDMILNVTK